MKMALISFNTEEEAIEWNKKRTERFGLSGIVVHNGVCWCVRTFRSFSQNKEEHDTCECGGTLIDIGRDKEDVQMFRCEKCGKVYYNERDL